MIQQQRKKAENSQQAVINLVILTVSIFIILFISNTSEVSFNYNSQILKIVNKIAEIPQPNNQNDVEKAQRMKKIEQILKNIPKKLSLKKIESTKGLQTVVKLYEIGFAGNINIPELYNRGRGIMSSYEVISVLMIKNKNDKILQTAHKSHIFQKYLNQKQIPKQQVDFCVFLSSHIPVDKQNIDQLQKIQSTLDSIMNQEYNFDKISVTIANIGQKSRIIQLAQKTLRDKYSKIQLYFIEQEQPINKIKAMSNYMPKICKKSQSVIVMINAADRLISPYTFKILNSIYYQKTKITSGRQIFGSDLTLSDEAEAYNTNSLVIQKANQISEQNGAFSPIRRFKYENLITFRRSTLEQLISLQKSKLVIQAYQKDSVSKNKETSIWQLQNPVLNPDNFDQSFIYLMVQLAGSSYTYISELLYEVNSYNRTQKIALPSIEIERQGKILENMKKVLSIKKMSKNLL